MNKRQRSKLFYGILIHPADRLSIDLQSFREALTVLQRQVDELDEMKAQHYQNIMEAEEEVWDVVQAKVRSMPELLTMC